MVSSKSNAVLFAVASYERELLKTLIMAQPAQAEDSAYLQGAFHTQFEVLWSRVNLLMRGTETRRIHSLVSFDPVIEGAFPALSRIESILDAGELTAQDVLGIRAELEPLLQPAHLLVTHAYTELGLTADHHARAWLKQSEWRLYGSFAGILLSSSALMLLLLRQIRTSERLLHASRMALERIAAQARVLKREMAERNRAEEEVRRLNSDLEQLVDERTAELRESQALLLRTERLAALGQVAATVSHELRNPLGTIRASLVSVRDKMAGGGEDLIRTLERIDRNVGRCDLIIDEMLDFSRTTSLRTERTSVDAWLAELLAEYEGMRKVSLVRELRAGVEAEIDPERLGRALVNVLDNAVQALSDGEWPKQPGLALAIVVRSVVVAGRLEFAVEDAGPGIPEALLPKVFEPLVSSKSFGVGLGLPNAQNILKQHGGDVELESREGEGTSVKLWLPLRAEAMQQERTVTAA